MLISKNTVEIVLPHDSTPQEAFAAEELSKYLTMIFERVFPITTDKEFKNSSAFAIGSPKRNQVTKGLVEEDEFENLTPGPEGIFIKNFGDITVIAGSDDKDGFSRGTVYAVYEFLERFLGCSFAAYSKPDVPAGEHISRLNECDISGIYYVKPAADVPYRAATLQFSSHGKVANSELTVPFLDWAVKNRYNYIYTWNCVYEYFKEASLLDEVVRRGLLFKVGHHDSINTLLPQRGNKYFPEHYYETHPEYYRLCEGGERFEMVNNWGQMVLCSRNEDCINQLAENLISWFKKNPQVKAYSFLNKDGTAPQCVCENCRRYTKSENNTYLINGIAKKLGKAIPDVRIETLAYTDLWEPPANMTLEKNVGVVEATWHVTGLRKAGKPDGSCLEGTFFEKNLLDWHALGAHVYYYDYFMGVYPGRQRYVPMADEMQAMCKRFIEVGIDGAETQIEVYNLWNNLFNFYTYGRTAYDVSLSLEDNLERFTLIFGEGAPYIAEYIRYAESVLDGQCEIMTAGVYFIKHADTKRIHRLLESALSAAASPTHRNNIRLLRMAFRYTEIETKEKYEDDERAYKSLKHYDIEERGELIYMKENFDSMKSSCGYGIAIPVEAEDNGFTPDKWYEFEFSN